MIYSLHPGSIMWVMKDLFWSKWKDWICQLNVIIKYAHLFWPVRNISDIISGEIMKNKNVCNVQSWDSDTEN